MSRGSNNSVTPSYVWAITIVAVLILMVLFLRPFLPVTILGLLLAFIFYPVYNFFGRKMSDGLAVLSTTVASVLVVGIPLVIVLAITVVQAVNFAETLADNGFFSGELEVSETVENAIEKVNDLVASINGESGVYDTTDVRDFATKVVTSIANGIVNLLLGIASGIPNFFTMLIIYFFVFTAGLTYGKSLRRMAEDISPFDKVTNKLYIDRMGLMAKAMIKGQLVIAIAQGFVSAAALALIGFEQYFLFAAVVFTFMSFIPLGAGIVTIPLGIFLVLIGNIGGGLLVLLNHFIVVTNIDNYIRPKVVPEDAQMPAVLTILSAFAGVAYFGFVGVIYGPMIMIFITTTIESYIKYKKRVESAS